MIINNNVYALNNTQVAFPVGVNKDSYTISSWFKQDIKTEEITVIHKLVKNNSYNELDLNKEYKEGAKYKEELYEGTYQQCMDVVNKIVLAEGEWRNVKGKPWDKVLEFTIK